MPWSRGGHDGAGELTGTADLLHGDDGHNARHDGHGDALVQGPEEEAVEHVVVEEHLGGEEVGAGVHLPLQIVQVGGKAGALHVALGVAGGADAQVLPAGQGADMGDELVGIVVVLRGGEGGVLGDVAPEGQNVLNAGGLEPLHHVGHLVPGGGDAGEVGQGGDPVHVLEPGGQLQGALGGGAAGAVGDADEVRGQSGGVPEDVLHLGQGGAGLGGKEFTGDGDPPLGEKLRKFHIDLLLVVDWGIFYHGKASGATKNCIRSCNSGREKL